MPGRGGRADSCRAVCPAFWVLGLAADCFAADDNKQRSSASRLVLTRSGQSVTLMPSFILEDGRQLKQSPIGALVTLNPATEVRLLILDEAGRAKRVADSLQKAGVRFAATLVDTEAAFVLELERLAPDLVLAGPTLPGNPERRVLEFVQRKHPEVPIMMVSDRAATDEAPTFVRVSAQHYAFNDDLTRLAPAVLSALHWKHRHPAAARAEALLRASEIRYRRLFEAARDGIFILDAETGIILDANPFMTDLLGYSHEEYLAKHVWEVGAFSDLIANRTAFEKLRQDRYIRYDDLPLKRKDGRLVDVEFVSNVYPADGHDTIQCNIRDITGRKLTEKKLFQAQKMAAVGILTGGVAHNINNLLSVIVGNVELLRTRARHDEQSEEYAHEAIEAALRGAQLISHMLAFARQQPLEPQRTDINDLVASIVRTLRGFLGEDIEIALHLTGEMIWPVLTDPAQLEATIMNLAVNAREAMPHGGKLDITTSNRHLEADADLVDVATTPGDYVEIAISDTGIGMSAELSKHIFEPFFSTKQLADKPGTGLGLSTAFGFVKQSGGNIGVESELGVGTTFRLFLPRLLEPEQEADPPLPQNAAGGRETVLVVEDNPSVRRAVVRQLTSLGYEVLECAEAATALAVLAQKRIDLLFTDVVIPGDLDGLKLARTALARWPSLGVLLTTGFGDTANRPEARGLVVLKKPYRTTDLACAMRGALDGHSGSAKDKQPWR